MHMKSKNHAQAHGQISGTTHWRYLTQHRVCALGAHGNAQRALGCDGVTLMHKWLYSHNA